MDVSILTLIILNLYFTMLRKHFYLCMCNCDAMTYGAERGNNPSQKLRLKHYYNNHLAAVPWQNDMI